MPAARHSSPTAVQILYSRRTLFGHETINLLIFHCNSIKWRTACSYWLGKAAVGGLPACLPADLLISSSLSCSQLASNVNKLKASLPPVTSHLLAVQWLPFCYFSRRIHTSVVVVQRSNPISRSVTHGSQEVD